MLLYRVLVLGILCLGFLGLFLLFLFGFVTVWFINDDGGLFLFRLALFSFLFPLFVDRRLGNLLWRDEGFCTLVAPPNSRLGLLLLYVSIDRAKHGLCNRPFVFASVPLAPPSLRV